MKTDEPNNLEWWAVELKQSGTGQKFLAWGTPDGPKLLRTREDARAFRHYLHTCGCGRGIVRRVRIIIEK